MKHNFSREFKCWPLSNNEHLNITEISAQGDDFESLMDSAECSIEDWNGNTRDAMPATELSTTDYAHVEKEIQSYLAGYREHLADEARDV